MCPCRHEEPGLEAATHPEGGPLAPSYSTVFAWPAPRRASVHGQPRGRPTLGLGQPGCLTCPLQALSREPLPLRGLPTSDLTLGSCPGLQHAHRWPSGSASPARDPEVGEAVAVRKQGRLRGDHIPGEPKTLTWGTSPEDVRSELKPQEGRGVGGRPRGTPCAVETAEGFRRQR